MPSAIRDVYVFVRRGHELLLMLRDGTGYRDGEWGPPSGKVEPGESYREGAARELREETGLVVESSDLQFVHLLDRAPEPGADAHWIGAFFEVLAVHGDAVNREPEKCRSIAWFPVDRLPSPVVDYVEHVLVAVAGGHRYSEWAESRR